jgi:hypothetical protein
MDDFWRRVIVGTSDRIDGPLRFRIVLQPAMAAFFAIRSGLRDSRLGKPPYFWALATDPSHRGEMAREGWKSVGKIFILALVLDVIFQIFVLHTVYPGGAIVVAIVLAIVPYLILRGVVTRIARKR